VVKVALWFCIIQDDLPTTATWPIPQVKAIHLEVDEVEPVINCQCICSAFSAQATEFPSGIKMQLVAEVQASTNPAACHKASQLCMLQAKFSANLETGLIHVQPHLAHNKGETYAILQKFLSTNGDSTEATQKPFYAVSPMVKKRASLSGIYSNIVPQHMQS